MKYTRTALLATVASAACAVVFWACEKDDICPQNSPKTPDARIEFYITTNGRPEESPRSSLSVFGLEGKERKEAIVLKGGDEYVELPVNFETGQSRYLFEEGTLTDTLTLSYEPELSFVSKACGYRFTFRNVTVSCTTEGAVESISKDIEEEPANGYLFNSAQVTARLFFKNDDTQAQAKRFTGGNMPSTNPPVRQ